MAPWLRIHTLDYFTTTGGFPLPWQIPPGPRTLDIWPEHVSSAAQYTAYAVLQCLALSDISVYCLNLFCSQDIFHERKIHSFFIGLPE